MRMHEHSPQKTQGDTMHRFIKPLVAAVALAAGFAQAAFPERPITIVVPYAPGGAADAVARVIATRMGEKLGGSVIVDNKPGASGTIGESFVAKAPADGYTMLYDATRTPSTPTCSRRCRMRAPRCSRSRWCCWHPTCSS
jgi:tripartite-type tricarboxylate transporter receptor subunit TctC